MTSTSQQKAEQRISRGYRIACIAATVLLWVFSVIAVFNPANALSTTSYAVAAAVALIVGIAMAVVTRRNAGYHSANTTSWIAGLFIADAVLNGLVGFGHVHEVAYRLALMLVTLLLGLVVGAIGAFGAARPKVADLDGGLPPADRPRTAEQAQERIAEIEDHHQG